MAIIIGLSIFVCIGVLTLIALIWYRITFCNRIFDERLRTLEGKSDKWVPVHESDKPIKPNEIINYG